MAGMAAKASMSNWAQTTAAFLSSLAATAGWRAHSQPSSWPPKDTAAVLRGCCQPCRGSTCWKVKSARLMSRPRAVRISSSSRYSSFSLRVRLYRAMPSFFRSLHMPSSFRPWQTRPISKMPKSGAKDLFSPTKLSRVGPMLVRSVSRSGLWGESSFTFSSTAIPRSLHFLASNQM